MSQDVGTHVHANTRIEDSEKRTTELIRRFKRKVEKFGILDEYKMRQTFLTKAEKKKLKRRNGKK